MDVSEEKRRKKRGIVNKAMTPPKAFLCFENCIVVYVHKLTLVELIDIEIRCLKLSGKIKREDLCSGFAKCDCFRL